MGDTGYDPKFARLMNRDKKKPGKKKWWFTLLNAGLIAVIIIFAKEITRNVEKTLLDK